MATKKIKKAKPKIISKKKVILKSKAKSKNIKAKPVNKGSSFRNVNFSSLSINKPFSKAEIVKTLSEILTLGKDQTKQAIDSLIHIIKEHLSKKGPGLFVFPGIAKFYVVHKPATKARQGINPFTGAPTLFAAKPARKVVKVKALKKLKDIVK